MGCRKYLTNDNFLPKITNLSIFNNKMSSQNIDPCGRLGTLKWRGRYYVCSTVDRAEQFGEEPDLYTSAVRALVARHTVLEQLLVTSHSGGQTQDGPLDSGDMKVVLTKSTSHCLTARRLTPPVRRRLTLSPPSSILITNGTSGT